MVFMLFLKMLNKIYLNLLITLIDFIDHGVKKKIISFFKLKLKDTSKLIVFDIGAHKGETVNLFKKNFDIDKIYSFEPNPNVFKILKKNTEKFNDVKIFNIGLDEKISRKYLNLLFDSSSSSFNDINFNNNYYKKKKKIFEPFSNMVEKKKILLETTTLSQIINKFDINQIDILKIDTEGYEYNVLKGIKLQDFKKIKYIYFEHHYDLMINKNYKFKDINQLLIENNYKLNFKIQMRFRKTFEYIYEYQK